MKPGKIIVKARQARLNMQARLGRVVTQAEAANAMGMDSAMLSRIEKRKTSGADWETLERLCAYYNVGICDLLEYTEDDLQIADPGDSEEGLGEESFDTALLTRPSSLVRTPVLV